MKTISRPISMDARGFTLVELMVAMAIAVFLVLGMMAITDVFTKSYRAQERVSDAQQGLRVGMDTMVRRIRMAGYDPMIQTNGPTAGNGIQVASATKIRVSADYNADAVINATDFEEITYEYDAASRTVTQTLYESTGGTPQVLVENVSGLTFTYLDEDGNSTATPSNIAMVVVQMTVSDRDRESGSTFQRTLTTRVNCRNLRL